MLSRHLRSLAIGLGVGCGLSLLSVGQPAAARPRNVNVVNTDRTPWEAVITIRQGDQGDTAGVLVARVPADQQLVLTDVVMTHNVSTANSTFRANIRRGSASNPSSCQTAGLVLGPFVSSNETVSINLTTGLVFEAGEQICVAIGGAGPNEGITFTFIGHFIEP